MARHLSSPAALIAAVALLMICAAAGVSAGCSEPCSCAHGIEFGESLCNYVNMTMDAVDIQVGGEGGPGRRLGDLMRGVAREASEQAPVR
jgi:hypothetical protein